MGDSFLKEHRRLLADVSVLKVLPLKEDDDSLAYWLGQTPQDRLRAVETLRFPDASKPKPTFQRVYRVVKLSALEK